MSRRRRTFALVGCVAVLLATAMLSGAAAVGAKNTSSQATTPIKLSVVTGGTGVGIADAALAQALGYFKKVGLDVSMQTVGGGSVLNTVVSGSVDIGAFSLSGIMLATARGQYMTAIYGYQGNNQAGALLARRGIKSIAQLKALPNCKLATGVPGTSLYGYMNHYIKTLGLQNCSTTQFGDSSTAVGAVVSGAYDAGALTYGDTINFVRSKQLNLLVNPANKAQSLKYAGPGFTTNAWFAKSNWLKSHRDAVQRFLKALGMADKALDSMSPTRLGAALHSLPGTDWGATTASDYSQQFKDLRPFLNPDHGYITKSNYNVALKAIASWGIPGFDQTNPQFQYFARVDMSYYLKGVGPAPKPNK